ncbi:MAG TPA: MBL fold metallo-hydrolase [Vicinamibacterales bacterium]|jgi:glyoxylase-like metal-dependent hydrolase (beta-lactamase superfamily II)|nr:MBL fold metallo-hydrolase [Vicinamibacterales bacterium]|tara:strand:+ start:1953 stop:3569 length:1617 start_codon:yes stop_codon:yes gene_type:complete
MSRRLFGAVAVLTLMGGDASAQGFPPGYVDPMPLLAAAAAEIGEANLRCITYSGSGYSGAVGQTFENAVNVDWPRIGSMANYTRTINWETATSIETFDREPGRNPASWKYGLGWTGGTPTQRSRRQTHIVNGELAWHIDGDEPPVAVPPEIAEVYRLEMWMNPHGFLKAARLPGANPVALWRWEQIEKGRDGNVVQPEKMHVVAITMFGKYRVDATINPQNQIQRIKTTVNIPALGDFNIEHESTNQRTFGDVKWPIAWHSHQGWDDNWQFYRQSTGHNAYGGQFPDVQPNVCGDPAPVPPSIRQATFPRPVTVERMADGVYLFGGGPANSYMVEFDDFVAVFEAPGNEARSLAVIEEVAALAPDKPIRWLITSHPHFDHIGGLRTYLHIGATIVTHLQNLEFLNSDVLSYEPRTVEPDIVSKWPPTELSEGYNYEAVQERYVITDNSRILHVYYVQPLQHVTGMLMAYLPAEHIAFQADLFDTHEPPKAAQLPAMRTLHNQVERMNLDVETLAPVHGPPVPWSAFEAAMTSLGSPPR